MHTNLLIFIPNILTLLRVFLTPAIVFLLLQKGMLAHASAWVLFTGAALSDALDGYIARRYGLVSSFGRFWDPVADKVLVWGLFSFFWLQGLLPWWMLFILVGRDLLVTLLRLRYRGASLAPSALGKLKTGLQFISLYALLFLYSVGTASAILTLATQVLVGCVTALVAVTGYQYVMIAVRMPAAKRAS